MSALVDGRWWRRLLGCLLASVLCGLAQAKDFERPPQADGGPTEVEVVIAVMDVDDISDANQSFTVNVVAGLRWIDSREAHDGEGNIKKPLTEVWYPNVLFLNRQRIWSALGEFVEVSPDGEVVYRQQFWGDFSQPMNLHDFPFDRQEFDIRIVYVGSEAEEDLKLIPNSSMSSFVADGYSVADWKVVDYSTHTDPLVVPNGSRVPSFTMSFTAQRLSQHYIIKVIAPLLMIVLLSWVVFWLNPTEGGSQLGVAVTAFLTVIAYHVALGSKLPEISYLTRLDVFVFCGTIIVFMAMIEVVITTGLAQKGKVGIARWLDRVCRFLFPGLLALGSAYAFLWH